MSHTATSPHGLATLSPWTRCLYHCAVVDKADAKILCVDLLDVIFCSHLWSLQLGDEAEISRTRFLSSMCLAGHRNKKASSKSCCPTIGREDSNALMRREERFEQLYKDRRLHGGGILRMQIACRKWWFMTS